MLPQKTESNLTMPQGKFNLITIAASAGGLEALRILLAPLPANFPVAIAVVQHLAPKRKSLLAQILSRRCSLIVKQAEDREHWQAGTVYIAPPDWHLLVNDDESFSLEQTKLMNFVRPSADVLFSSAAERLNSHLIAVILTGTGVDGSKGIEQVKQHGGVTIAQDQQSSEHFGMPRSAISTGSIDFVLPLTKISPRLISLVIDGVTLDPSER